MTMSSTPGLSGEERSAPIDSALTRFFRARSTQGTTTYVSHCIPVAASQCSGTPAPARVGSTAIVPQIGLWRPMLLAAPVLHAVAVARDARSTILL